MTAAPDDSTAAPPALLDDLTQRGLCQDSTDPAALAELLATGSQKLYVGFDPTADSLHVGSLLGLVTLKRFVDAGHLPILLVGGATGMVGDPSGRSDERNLLDEDTLAHNLAGIQAQAEALLGNQVQVVNNWDWMSQVGVLQFLREVGKHVTVNQMVAKDSVRSRMEGEAGISYTEFSYMLLQAYDFWWLHQNHDCRLQLGGSDQWGNITAGIDLIRRREGAQAHGLTWPLLTRADGQKFGKTAQGTIWLSPERTIPFEFHQYFLRCDDRDVAQLLKQLTSLALPEIAEVMAAHEAAPEERAAQRRLADEVTAFVHGTAEVAKANAAAEVFYGTEQLTTQLLEATRGVVPEVVVSQAELSGGGGGSDSDSGSELGLAGLLQRSGLCKSLGDARRQLKQSAVQVNKERVAGDLSGDELQAQLLGSYLLLQKGKKDRCLVVVE